MSCLCCSRQKKKQVVRDDEKSSNNSLHSAMESRAHGVLGGKVGRIKKSDVDQAEEPEKIKTDEERAKMAELPEAQRRGKLVELVHQGMPYLKEGRGWSPVALLWAQAKVWLSLSQKTILYILCGCLSPISV